MTSEEFKAYREKIGLGDVEEGKQFSHCKAVVSRVEGSLEFKTCARFTSHEVNGTALCSTHTNHPDVHWSKKPAPPRAETSKP